MRIGPVSDTHDLLRPAALDFLRGSDHFVHAGDVCGPRGLAHRGGARIEGARVTASLATFPA